MAEKPTYEQLERRVQELEQAELECKQIREKVRESRDRFQMLYERVPLGYQSLDKNGNLIEVNPAWLNNLGYLREEVIGKPFSAFLHPDWTNHFEENFPRFKSIGEVLGVEFELVRKDGSYIPVSFYGKIGKDGNGGFLQTHCIFENITERKQVEGELRKSEERYRLLADNVSDVIWTMDMNLRFTYVSPSIRSLRGYSAEEVADHTLDQVLTPESFKEAMEILSREWDNVLKGLFQPMIFELEFNCRDGSTVWGESTISVIYDAEGAPIEILGVTRDITERKQAKEALLESERKFRSVVDFLGVGISVLNPKLEVTAMNPLMRKWFPDVDIENRPVCYKVYNNPPRTKPCDYCPCVKAFQDGSSHEAITDTPAGDKIRHFRILASPIKNKNDEVTHVIEVIEDLTTQKQTEKEKNNLQQQLQQSRKMDALGTLAGGIAHDFNNILAIIMANTELALDDVPVWHPAHYSLLEIKTASHRARGVIHSILNFVSKTDYENQPVEIVEIVQESIKLMRATIPASITINQNISDIKEMIVINPTHIHEVILNLCSNAAHAMEGNDGVMNISLEHAAFHNPSSGKNQNLRKYIKFTVSDTGHGIAPENIDRIFDPYFTTKKVGEGSGLGLSIVYGILKDIGGEIIVSSEPGKGTTFEVFFPVFPRDAAVTESLSSGSIPTGHERILLVDDEEQIVQAERRVLERLGYQVTAMTSSMDTLAEFGANPDKFDLVITDMAMPEMTGDQLVIKLLEIRPDIPIILCTGYSHWVNSEKARSIGARELMMKPLDKHILAKTIRRVLDEAPQP